MNMLDIEFYDPFEDDKYKGFFGRYRKAATLFREYLKKPFLIVMFVFIVVMILSSIFFYSTKETTYSFFEIFGDAMEQNNVINAQGEISPLGLFINNLRACVIAFALGFIPFLFAPSLTLVVNSLIVGLLTGYIGYSTGANLSVSMVYCLAGILPHGIFELTAIWLSISMGYATNLQINRRIMKKKTKWTTDFLMGEMAWYIVVWLIPLLAVAAVVETYVTPMFLSWVMTII